MHFIDYMPQHEAVGGNDCLQSSAVEEKPPAIA